MSVTERYALLREEIGPHVGTNSNGCINVQWVGLFECAQQVMSANTGGFKVPHEIGGAFVLRDSGPRDIDFVPTGEFRS